ncbi:MAG: tRNA(Ile)(2)-agmatinylcytidine synthase [Candidatus Altiarchaeota archaeon]|nr:tRNA(Ile)(2)-agmatinylcytidine synthase [Candidatus Altiarchaeota archaeon]
MFVGVDDTDSLEGGCTTYLAALLCEKLGTTKLPKLIRLNPNIPYKTRGNGAVALEVSDENPDEMKETVLKYVRKHSHLKNKETNPGVAFLERGNYDRLPVLNEFYKNAVSKLVQIKDAEEAAGKAGAVIHKFRNGRGIIGALAAIGADLSRDKTYELIAYREGRNYGKRKKVDKESVFKMNRETYPETFDSIDPEKGQVLITPHGYDPVFCGIRGESPGVVTKAFKLIKPLEEIERTQVFETNQGTDAHLINKKISELRPYDCAILLGEVLKKPESIEGGHIIFKLRDDSGEIDCAAYQPTGGFRDTVRQLIPGDMVRAYGGIGKYPDTINLEKIMVMELKTCFKINAPLCCGRRMTSAGKDKGFKCRKCKKRLGEDAVIRMETSRDLKQGFYEVPPRARRHLSKPLIRI